MMSKPMAEESTAFLRLVEERALSKKQLEEEKKKQILNLVVPYLPKDCISNILVRLPIESLHRSRFVCKPWHKIVNTRTFIDTHLHRAENVFIFLDSHQYFHRFSSKSLPKEKPNTFSLEAKLFQRQNVHVFNQPDISPSSKFHLKYMEIKDGKSKIGEFNATCLGRIRATCNGLILLDNKMKKGGLIVMNPVTKEFDPLPLGSIYPSHDESYGLAFCESAREYKVVHLFRDEMQFVGCEILKLGTRYWIPVDGPSFGLFNWFGYDPVFAIGGLHWSPEIDHYDYIVSMGVDDEKFIKIPLPKNTRYNERIIEMGGFLCYVAHEEMNQIDVWILKNLSADNWTKNYTITVGCIRDMVPLYCSRFNGEMVLKDKDGTLYSYDFELQVMRRVDIGKGCFYADGCFFPHVNSLVSWQTEEKGQDIW